MASYLIGNEAKSLQNGDVHLSQIPDFEMGYLENHWYIEVSDGSFFCIFHALSFEPNFFRPEFPFNALFNSICTFYFACFAFGT